jgi:hypothetical protein
MTTHAQMDGRTGILPCCGAHWVSRLFSGDGSTDNPEEIDCAGGAE